MTTPSMFKIGTENNQLAAGSMFVAQIPQLLRIFNRFMRSETSDMPLGGVCRAGLKVCEVRPHKYFI